MSWKQFMREVERSSRRSERRSLQRHRQLVREQAQRAKMHAKLAEQDAARSEVEQYESYLDVLLSVHKDCNDPWDWQQLRQIQPPAEPTKSSQKENGARAALQSYKPGFFDKIFRLVPKRIAALERNIKAAIEADNKAYMDACKAHREVTAECSLKREVAADVLGRTAAGLKRGLEYANPFDELAEFKTRVVIETLEPDVIALNCYIEDDELVPTEEIKLTATGKVSRKEMPASRYWALHQDHVCSCVLRIARETLAVLPLDRVIVNVAIHRFNSGTGHKGDDTILAVHFTRSAMERINMETIDPSDSLKNFNYRMRFKKTAGFDAVEPITPDEQWVSA